MSKAADWKQAAWSEIQSIKPYYIQRHGWEIKTEEDDDSIRLHVKMAHQEKGPVKVFLLTYTSGFPEIRPREDFVNPDNYSQSGIEYWIEDNQQAFKTTHNEGPIICLQGTWGFHHVLHKDRDPLQAKINLLLKEVQLCFNRI